MPSCGDDPEQSFKTCFCAAQAEGCSLQRLDARGNCLGALRDVAVLAGCTRLQELSLQGAPRTPCCTCSPEGVPYQNSAGDEP